MGQELRDHMKGLLGESGKPPRQKSWRDGKDLCPRCGSEWGKGWVWCQRCGQGRPS